MKKNTIIIAGFPGVGKTVFFNELKQSNKDITVLDSDSSKYSWLFDEYGQKKIGKDGKPVRNPDFIKDYLYHIKSNMGKVDIILVSTHADVQKALSDNNIHYYIVYPDISLKEEWLERIAKRTTGLNNETFVSLIEKNFENWIAPLEKETFPTLIKLPYNGEKGISLKLVDMIKELEAKKFITNLSINNVYKDR